MIIEKEYAATHSMFTSWFFVDENDEVAIVEVDDNGPVPVGAAASEISINELCYHLPVFENGNMLALNYSPDQILNMLEGNWQDKVDDKVPGDDFFMIYPNRETEFLDNVRMFRDKVSKFDHITKDYCVPVCISKEYGLYQIWFELCMIDHEYINSFINDLFENGILLKYCHRPDFEIYTFEYDKDEIDSRSPYYIYVGDYDPANVQKLKSKPIKPVKLSQFPEELQKKTLRLPIRFNESDSIQIAMHHLCCSNEYTYDTYGGTACVISPEGKLYEVVNSAKTQLSQEEIAEQIKNGLVIKEIPNEL